ncbi:MAG: type II secretion system F family protein [Nitrospinae bacterium]|nr:type II secretion system F family protein [Nitrospinota bacterium]
MPVYEYSGYGEGGKSASGVIDADSPRGAAVKLRKMGVLPTEVRLERHGAGAFVRAPLSRLFSRVTAKEITAFTRQLATLQSAGLTLVESLDAQLEQAHKPRFKSVIADVRERVLAGSSLAGALAAHPRLFDTMYVSLTRAGEASGALGRTLSSLADFGERRQRQQARIMAAMIYPAIMTLVGSGVMLFLLAYVVPRTQEMFDDIHRALPLPTVILLAVSNFLAGWWWALLALAFMGGAALARWAKTAEGRARLDTWALRVPVLGEVWRAAAVARFAGAMATLLAGGVELVEALRITRGAAGSVPFERAMDAAVTAVTEGQPLAAPLRQSNLFPPVVIQMVAAGERSGELTRMFADIARAYEFEMETTVGALTALVEPLLILVMGAAVGFIVLAILLPIFELSQAAR